MGLFAKLFGGGSSSDGSFSDEFVALAREISSNTERVLAKISQQRNVMGGALRAECATFALSYCTLITMASAEMSNVEGEQLHQHCDTCNAAALKEFVSSGWIADASQFTELLQRRFPEYSQLIQYEILPSDAKNEHGGPHFAFAKVYTNAHGLEPMNGPLMEIMGEMGALMDPLMKGGEKLMLKATRL